MRRQRKKEKPRFNNCAFVSQNSKERKGEHLLNLWGFLIKFLYDLRKKFMTSEIHIPKKKIFRGSFF